MEWYFIATTLFVVWIIRTLISLLSHYTTARHIGFPIVISPVSTLNPLWIITCRAFPQILWLRYLPFDLGKWARCAYIGWTFDDKHAFHDELGPIFTTVTPACNEVIVADSSVAESVFSKRKEFIKPAVMYDQLNVFGPNLNTVEGKDWERQRRLTAPHFNERTSAAVWNEAVRQAVPMLQSWLRQGRHGTREVVADTATLALHVLTLIGFDQSYPFHGGVRTVAPGHSMTYKDALSVCLKNIMTFAILPKDSLGLPFMPSSLRTVGVAAKEFQIYMEEMLLHQHHLKSSDTNSSPSLVGALVRASASPLQHEDEMGRSGLSLSQEEVYGNIFAFNLAGHETTANTVAMATVLLAAHPECQDWIQEEIDWLSQEGDLSYENAFPRARRCLATMYETLRLYGSIVFIPKTTGFHTQHLDLNQNTHVLPPDTAVNINVQALHSDPTVWGSDSLEWRPSRWLKIDRSPLDDKVLTLGERLINPKPGSYVPWADGPRVCIGKKFSQVEFVATILTLFTRHRVGPVVELGQTTEYGNKKLMQMVNTSAIHAITLQMTKPREVALAWTER